MSAEQKRMRDMGQGERTQSGMLVRTMAKPDVMMRMSKNRPP